MSTGKGVKNLNNKEIQNETTVKFHLTSSRITTLKIDNIKCWQEYRFITLSICCWWK